MTEGTRRPPKRLLSRGEAALWDTVTRAVKPLRALKIPQQPTLPPLERPSKHAPEARDAAPAPEIAPRPVSRKPAAKPLIGLDRRLKRRIARGTAEIDARLDLHGLTLADAHDALVDFLRRARSQGARVVLVITGKGTGADHGYGHRGVLRRQVPHWLTSYPLRNDVLAIEPAHAGHGGEGALYVRLRRARGAGARNED